MHKFADPKFMGWAAVILADGSLLVVREPKVPYRPPTAPRDDAVAPDVVVTLTPEGE